MVAHLAGNISDAVVIDPEGVREREERVMREKREESVERGEESVERGECGKRRVWREER